MRFGRSGIFVAACALILAAVNERARAADDCNQAAPQPITHIALPGNPFAAVSTQDGCTIFVSLTDEGANSKNGIAVLSRSGGRVALIRMAAMPEALTDLILAHDGRLLIAANGQGALFLDTVRLLSGIGNPVLGSITDGIGIPPDTARYMGAARTAQTKDAGSSYLNVTADGRFLFVADEWTQAITVVDLAEGLNQSSIVGTIPVGVLPIALTFSPDEKYLYTTSQIALRSYGWPLACKREGADPARTALVNPQGAILVIDVAKAKTNPSDALVSKVPAGCAPVRLALSPDGKTAYVTARNSNAMLAFDTQKLVVNPARALIGQVPVGIAPVGIAVFQGGQKIIVTNSNRFAGNADDKQTLTIIDVAKIASGAGAVVGSIPAGAFPREIRITTDQRTILVTNYASKTLELLDIARLPM